MAGHAQLKFVITECSKTQIRLTRLICALVLTINTSKSNVLIFSRARMPHYEFTLNGTPLEVVSEYKYLGILFCRSGSFLRAKKHIADQARKAIFALLKKVKQLLLPVDIQIDLFTKCIRPILLYGCEVWGYGNMAIIEQVQLRFLKLVLNLKKKKKKNTKKKTHKKAQENNTKKQHHQITLSMVKPGYSH